MEKGRKRKITICVLPHEGYNIGLELWKDTPLEEVLGTLSELGFERIQEHIDDHKWSVEAELIDGIFEKFLSISRDYGASMKNINEFYERWLDVGFNIADLKNRAHKNSPSSNDRKTSEIIIKIDDVESGSEINPLVLPIVEQVTSDNPYFKETVSNIESDDNPPGGATAVSGDVARSNRAVIDPVVTLIDNDKVTSDSISLIVESDEDSCMYCRKFKDIGTMVCPHCGRPLNL